MRIHPVSEEKCSTASGEGREAGERRERAATLYFIQLEVSPVAAALFLGSH